MPLGPRSLGARRAIDAISWACAYRIGRALLIRLQKVFEKSVNLIVRIRCRAVAFPIGHSYAVGISKKQRQRCAYSPERCGNWLRHTPRPKAVEAEALLRFACREACKEASGCRTPASRRFCWEYWTFGFSIGAGREPVTLRWRCER